MASVPTFSKAVERNRSTRVVIAVLSALLPVINSGLIGGAGHQ